MTFDEFGFDERIQKGIEEAGFQVPMPVQAQCFDLLIKNHRDVYAQSQTGTGKTAAFLLGIFQLVTAEEKYLNEKALIIVPTRELAVQIEQEGKTLGKYLNLRIGAVFGGVGYNSQEKMLEDGLDIVVGTPGRLIDFSKQKKINLKDFAFLVIDEADRLFDMGFLPDLRRILKGMRPYNERHTMLFSATLNARVGNLAWEYMNDPGEVIIEPEKVTVDSLSQELYHVGKDEKMKLLLGVLRRDDPENAVIFTNTRHSAWEVAKRLEVNGYAVEFLMGDLPQSKRLKIVDAVKKGKHKFLVATDVAARGLHIDELEMVINYDVPLEAESYVHRIGRTARAGREGKTVTLACEEYVYGLNPIEKLLGEKIPVSWADENLVAVEDKSEGMRFPPQQRYRELDRGQSGGRASSSRDSRGRSASGRRSSGASRASGKRQSMNGKKPLQERAAEVQSAVSSVAGRSDFMKDDNGKDERNNSRKKKGLTGKRKRATENAGKVESRKAAPVRNGRTRTDEKKESSERAEENRSYKTFDGERVTALNSEEERLAYYRKKYGEDFQFSGSSGGRKAHPKKSKSKAARRKPAEGRRAERGAAEGRGAERGGAGRSGVERGAAERSQLDSRSARGSGKTDKTGKPAAKKGLFSRLFGK